MSAGLTLDDGERYRIETALKMIPCGGPGRDEYGAHVLFVGPEIVTIIDAGVEALERSGFDFTSRDSVWLATRFFAPLLALVDLNHAGMVCSASLVVKFRRPQYRQYLGSVVWKERRAMALDRADNRCQICNLSADKSVLDVHHRTYERLGFERPEDLTVLCRECHRLYSEAKRLPPPPEDEER